RQDKLSCLRQDSMNSSPFSLRFSSARRNLLILNFSFLLPNFSASPPSSFILLLGVHSTPKKSAQHFQRSAFCRAANALLNFNKLRIARADHPLRIHKAVHVNRDPAAVHEHEVRVPD